MYVMTCYIPKSEKGHKIAKYLRAAGYNLRTKDVIGRYVSQLPCAAELTYHDLSNLAWLLNPKVAAHDREYFEECARYMREHPGEWGLSPDDPKTIEQAAETLERSWVERWA